MSSATAYQANFSTETLLTSNILCSRDKQQMSFLVLLNQNAAFDSVSHSRIFAILITVFNIKNMSFRINKNIYHKDKNNKVNSSLSSEFFSLSRSTTRQLPQSSNVCGIYQFVIYN